VAYRSRTRRSRGPRRKLTWARSQFSVTGAALPGIVRIDLLAQLETAVAAQLLGCTVMRIRGVLALDQSLNGVLVAAARVGAANETIIAGLAPYGAPYLDWMMWEPFVSTAIAAGGDAAARVVDVKSRRRLDRLNESLYLFIDTTNPAGTLDYSLDLSVLIALP